jgi:[acyl-carrier-protein] S-malonyltransferase
MRAIVFPGQGAQYVGMGKSFYDNFPEAKEVFSFADRILGYRLSNICFYGPIEELKKTDIQQLAILVVSIAGYEVFKKRGLADISSYLCGLSLGEYTCLYAAGVLGLEETIFLVKERAKAMGEAARENPSCMLAVIGKDLEELDSRRNRGFYIANLNSPQQVVISVSKEKKESVKRELQEWGARVVELQVSGGFHSPFMESAKNRLEKVVANLGFRDAEIPIVSNFTGKAHTNKEEIKNNLLNQLIFPVLWMRCVEFMISKGVDYFIEIGPSRVLKGLIKKINSDVCVINIENSEDIASIGVGDGI